MFQQEYDTLNMATTGCQNSRVGQAEANCRMQHVLWDKWNMKRSSQAVQSGKG